MSAGQPVPAATPAPATHAHYVRAVLGDRGFRRLLSVRLIAQLGDGAFQGALAGSVLFNPDKGSNAVAIAAGFAALLLPYSLIGPYVGVLLDRWSRRSIFFVANLSRGLLILPTALFMWRGQQSVTLFLLALTIIGLNRFFLAGMSAATPHVVEDRMLVTANSLASTIGSLVYSLGLGAAALLVKTVLATSFHGYALVCAAAAIPYVASACLARVSFGPDALGPHAVNRQRGAVLAAIRRVARETLAGVRHLAGKRGAAAGVLAQGLHRALYGVLLLDTLLLFRTVFNSGRDVTGSFSGIGKAFAAGGLGLLLAAFVTPPLARRVGGWRWVTGLLVATGLAIVAFGLPFRPMLLLVAVFVVNVAAQGIKIVVDTSLQHECDDVYRGRVFSVNDTAFNLMLVAGMYGGALLLPPNGESTAMIVAISVAYLVLAGAYAMVAGRWARRVGDDIAQPDGAPRPGGDPAEQLSRSC